MAQDYSINIDREPVIMGILNVTPDSFSDGGKFTKVDAALMQVDKMTKEGAKIIDVGGESTRPGYTPITIAEEIDRVIPVIEAIRKRFEVPLSIDTYKAAVAQAALDAGCDMVNDIWGFRGHMALKHMKFNDTSLQTPFVKSMAKVVAEAGVPVIVGHNRFKPKYDDFMQDVLNDLRESIDLGHAAGVRDNQIIVDPGVGFAKTYKQNLYIVNHIEEIRKMGYPVLIGCSRKSVIRETLKVDDPNDLLGGSVATTVIGLERGARLFRVHDVKENYQAMMTAWKFMNSQRY